MALAIDHRAQFEAMADGAGRHRSIASAPSRPWPSRPPARVAGGRPGFGMLHRRHLWPRGAVPRRRPSLLDRAAGRGARLTAARFRGRRPTSAPSWSSGRSATRSSACASTIPTIRGAAGAAGAGAASAHDAARRIGRELLIEIICGKNGRSTPTRSPRVLDRLYELGIKPDWWKLEPQADAAAWREIEAVIERERSLLPRHRAARPRSAGGGAGGGLRGWRRTSRVSRVRGRPHYLRRSRRAHGWPAR